MRAAATLIIVAAGLAAAAPARAHGDPITDSLLTASIFFPPEVNVADALVRELTTEVQKAQEKGAPVKVAIVNAPSDLGPRSGYFGKAQPFAVFVARDLSAFYSGAILVVMPTGFGFVPAAGTSKGIRTLRSIPIGTGPNGLTQAAVDGVRRLAGVKSPAGETDGSGGSRWRDRIVLAAAVLAGLVVVAAARAGRRRARNRAVPD